MDHQTRFTRTYIAAARLLGRTLAERGLRLIYGGGKTGLMGAVADGVLEAGGEVIGVIIPSMNTVALPMCLTQMDVVDGMHARKARMHELTDGYIALPGGLGLSTNYSKPLRGRKQAPMRNLLVYSM